MVEGLPLTMLVIGVLFTVLHHACQNSLVKNGDGITGSDIT